MCFSNGKLYPYFPSLLHWHWDNYMLTLVPTKILKEIICRIKTGHSNLVSCFGPRMRALAKVFYQGESRGPKHDTRFEWPVSILIMTRYPFLPFKTHKTSAKNPCLLTIAGAIWFCRYRQCTPSQLWMHAPVAKERRLMTSQYPIFDRKESQGIWILGECKLSTDDYVNH